ncbi:MAG: toxin-antitoxin system protein [Selenomonadaceae bacterium]|nr:toxin-antitoxin system protein [Selenomonadaceae bacterium]
MSPLRQEAIQLLERMPEEKLITLIQFMQAESDEQLAYRKSRPKNRNALEELLKLCKPVPDLDYKKELAQYRGEKFGNANLG